MKKKAGTMIQVFKTTIRLVINFGIATGIIYFVKNVVFRKDNKLGRHFHKLQYDSIKKSIEKKYHKCIEKYQEKTTQYKFLKNQHGIVNDKYIWLIWWQGLDGDTPGKIKENVENLKKVNNDWKVVLVSKENYKEFINIPCCLEEHIRKGKISMTHISDYLRIALLEKYGGVYIDCNFFVLRKFEFEENQLFFTIKHGLFSKWHVSKGLWTTGLLAAGRKNILFTFLKEMYDNYFEDYSFVPSYFFIDVLIGIGYENVSLIKKEIDDVRKNNEEYNFINENGNDIFDNKVWQKVKKNTYVFNVNYKNYFEYEKLGRRTYYGNLYREK